MQFTYVQPSGFLRHFIRHYWVLECDSTEGEVCERVIPTGTVEWMFHYGIPFVVKQDSVRGEAAYRKQPRSLVTGLCSHFSDVAASASSGVIAVTFHPYGASSFLPFPVSEIEEQSFALSDVFDIRTADLEEQLVLASSLKERIGLIERFLWNCYRPIREDDLRLMQHGVEWINQCRGRVKASELSSVLPFTSRSLERKFSAYLGKSPKQFLRIVRFQATLLRLSERPVCSLTELAYECGYFDQAHFVKDFKELSGYTPGEFLALGPCQADYFQ